MSQQLDLDINHYTQNEIFALFNLDPSKCTMSEADSRISDSLFQLADLADSQDYTRFFTQCREMITQKIGERTKPYDATLFSGGATAYRPPKSKEQQQQQQQQDTLSINYSTPPSNYTTFHRESDVNEGGAYAKRNIAPVINAYNYKYPTGVLNPIERRVIKRLLSMDTLFRTKYDSTTATNASWVLPYPVENVVSMKIASLQIPNMWYAFSEATKTNRFVVSMTGLNVAPYVPSQTYTNDIIIPDGNYTGAQFVQIMNNLFQNTQNGMEFFQMTINAYTGKLTISQTYLVVNQTNSPNLAYTVAFDNVSKYDKYYSTCINECEVEYLQQKHAKEYYNANIKSISKTAGWMMGFQQPVYQRTWANTFVDSISQVPAVTYYATLTATSAYGNNSIWNYMYVDVDDYNKNFITNSILAQTGDSYLGVNLLGRIPIGNEELIVINDSGGDPTFKTREYLGPVRLEKLTIRLLDKFGNVIPTNGNDYSIALELQVLYN
jgi:hypothetical protein